MAILGVGSLRCAPPVFSALATYFGERPLEIRLYDADEERLDLMDRFARACFQSTRATHDVLYRPDPAEALEDVDRVVLMVGRNCARKFMRVKFADADSQSDALITGTLETLLKGLPSETDILSLERKSVVVPVPFYRRMDWPGEPADEDLRWLPHQILRWVKGEEMMYKFLEAEENSPFKAWLEDPNAAEIVVNRAHEV
jgi:hypothetical protein